MNQLADAIQVRRATQDDAATISALIVDVQQLHADALPHIFKPASPKTFPPETVRALMAEPDTIFFLSEEAGEAAGYLYAKVVHRPDSPFRHETQEIQVDQIAVKPDFQRRGHGERLIAAAKSWMRTHGITLLTLSTWAFNEPAQAFFKRQGFEPMVHHLWIRDDVA